MSDTPRTDEFLTTKIDVADGGECLGAAFVELREHARALERELAADYERAAKVCEEMADGSYWAPNPMLMECAAIIRALKS